MRKQRGKTGIAGTGAGASAGGKRRKASRAKHGATSQPKLTGRRRRDAQPAVVMPVQQTSGLGSRPAEAAVSDAVVVPAVSTDVVFAATGPDHDPIIDAVSLGDAAALQLDEADGPLETPPVSAPVVGIQPGAAADIVRDPSRSRRARPAVMRWTAAAAILVACVLALAKLSDTQVSAYAVANVIQAGQPHPAADAVPHAGLPPLQVVSLEAPPASASLVAPHEADLASQNLAATLAPSAREHVLARDGAPAPRIAKLRPPVRKPVGMETATTPPPTEPARLTGRGHALGRYEMRWGTARLHEDPNADNAQGPSWDFVASAGAR